MYGRQMFVNKEEFIDAITDLPGDYISVDKVEEIISDLEEEALIESIDDGSDDYYGV